MRRLERDQGRRSDIEREELPCWGRHTEIVKIALTATPAGIVLDQEYVGGSVTKR